jgi:hypothetical protein
LPLKVSRSRKGSRRRPNRPMEDAGAIPEMFVQVDSWRGGGYSHHVAAHIQLRREKYRYLVWYVDGKKQEFYLGKVKTVPLRYRGRGRQASGAAARRSRDVAGARK